MYSLKISDSNHQNDDTISILTTHDVSKRTIEHATTNDSPQLLPLESPHSSSSSILHPLKDTTSPSISSSKLQNTLLSFFRKSSFKSLFLYPFLRLVFVFTFFFSASFLTRFITMHILVPSVDLTQPPLRDLVLDQIETPFPEAFKMTETITVVMCILMFVLAFFNRTHRFNIVARYFLLNGYLLMLRLMSISSTLLSIPNPQDVKKCQLLQEMSTFERLMGPSSSREHTVLGYTCGDYMFSGHSCGLILSTFFVIYYSSIRSFHGMTSSHVHSSTDTTITSATNSLTFTFSSKTARYLWIGMRALLVVVLLSSCVLGLFGIVWSKEHYTADVVVACIITFLLCLVYHYQLHLYCEEKERRKGKDHHCHEFTKDVNGPVDTHVSLHDEDHANLIDLEQANGMNEELSGTLTNSPASSGHSKSAAMNGFSFTFFSLFEFDMDREDLLMSQEFDLKPLECLVMVWTRVWHFVRGTRTCSDNAEQEPTRLIFQ
ncbi:hypothetical protein FDP41_000912 [Naegleria fowleri]|uniref:Sphingomyelin synthase-like domain-containing protein n=1 Tax=Naegleria fowleri TaxID=5763 RepID=A0A6A5C3A0_NAEFO|nr:uncharacterized protein FDP41_000912 [Naegleria fowleri]KAF0979759.1 hypothetical protein FDP41_000912 [Naegleria fowleri]